MALDDRGRLWVAEAYAYPVRVPEKEARDRILIFEDTDGDAKFDKRSVFIEGLNLVSGLELGFGGVWVGAAPELLFIADRDGDDKPDGKPEVVLDGWGYHDTHETLNSFIWGPDGWLYGCHGVFTHSNVGKPGAQDSERTKLNAGIWRYHPVRREFEVFAEGTSNPWGVDFNDRGQAFATACVIPHLYHIIQGARYQRQAGQHFNPHTYDDIKTIAKHRHWVGNQWNNEDRVKSDSIGGGHAHAGAMIYLGGKWPAKYRNQLFMNNIHGARLNQDQLTAEGSGYVGDAAPDFCFANDIWSQIIYLTYGPDGNVYMIDWYDRNQCHHGRQDGHDRSNGRIFKIVYGESKPVQVDLKKLSDEELVDLQLHENEWYARHARRVLQERAAAGKLGDIRNFLVTKFATEQATQHSLRLLWTMHVTGLLGPEAALALLDDKNPDVRAWTIQCLCESGKVSDDALAKFAALAKDDPSPVVRMYLASGLQRLPLAQRWDTMRNLLGHSDDATDHNLPLLYWYTAEPLAAADPAKALELTQSGHVPLVARYTVRRIASDPAGYEALFAALTGADEPTQEWMLAEIVAALKVRADLKMPASWKPAFEKLIAAKNDTIRQQAEFIAVKFGDARVLPALRQTLADKKLPLPRRELALASLVAAKDPALPPVLHGLLEEAALRGAAINALATFDHSNTPRVLIAAYDKLPPMEQQAAIATLTSRPAYVLELLDAIEKKSIPRTDLNAFTVRQLAALNNEVINKRLNDVWGTIREASADKLEEMASYKKRLTAAAMKNANLPHGREVYNKTCATCHTLFGAGKQIGPDLTGSNRANLDYLLENLLDPSAVVGKDYLMTIIITADGRSLNGLIKEETDSALTLQTPTDVVTVAKKDIEERALSPLSLMPDGQLKTLQPNEVRDLVAYLASPQQVPLPGEGPWLDPASSKVAGAQEGESLKVLRKSAGNAGPQAMNTFPLGKWSNQSQLWWTGAKPQATLELEFTAPSEGEYEVYVALTKAIDYGIVALAIDDGQPSAPIDAYNDGVIHSGPLSLGTHKLSAGKHRLVVTIDGANPKAVKGYMFGLDYLWLQKK
jgi:putative membrane-bound dehydrogenase-like protein